jgi:hypothetical protein
VPQDPDFFNLHDLLECYPQKEEKQKVQLRLVDCVTYLLKDAWAKIEKNQ